MHHSSVLSPLVVSDLKVPEMRMLEHVAVPGVRVDLDESGSDPLVHVRVRLVDRLAEPSASHPSGHVLHQLVLLLAVASHLPQEQAVGLGQQQRLQRRSALVVLQVLSPEN